MNLLESDKIRLRALEPEDVDVLYKWENDTAVWGVSHTLLPFSKHILNRFIAGQADDIYQTRQTRFVIEAVDGGHPVGVIDLFDFDPYHQRCGVGILVYEPDERRKGYAEDAVRVLVRYGFGVLKLRQLYCSIPASNVASQQLFGKCGFVLCGQRKEWLRRVNGWEDEYMYQLLNPSH